MDPLRIVIGLGNPRARYRWTRHNLGFRVVDRVAARRGVSFAARGELGRKAWTAEAAGFPDPVVLAKPRTYMNRSGRAAAALCRHYDAAVEQLLVVYDDADLQLGQIRIRPRGGSGGHNGLRSLIDALGSTQFPRVRLGVLGRGRGDADLADYVLEAFDAQEQPVADALVALGADAVEAVLSEGLGAAMNRFNACSVAP